MSGRRRPKSAPAGVAVAVAAILALAGCGQAAPRGSELASYLKHVQRVETLLKRPLGVVAGADRALAAAQRSDLAPHATAIVAAERSLRSSIERQRALRAQLAAIDAPAAAARLRALVLQLADRQISLTRELAGLVVFLPRFRAALVPLAPATRRLKRVLATGGTYAPSAGAAAYARKAAGLRRFKAAVTGVVAQLRRLHPPAVSLPEYRTQLASLHGMSASAGRLADALTGRTATDVPALLLSFDRSASLSRTVPAQRAQIAAIRAWDGELAGLRKLSVAVARERYRLVRAVS